MTEKTIRRLKIENFKSIDSLEVKGLAPFSVFAGRMARARAISLMRWILSVSSCAAGLKSR